MFYLQEFLPYRLYRLSESAGIGFRSVYKDRAGLTRPQWRVLATLGEAGAMTATRLGQHTGMHKTKVSRAIAALEMRRWVVREKHENDRRFEDVTLTKTGNAAYADLANQAFEYNENILKNASASERADIEKGLKTLENLMRRAGIATVSAPCDVERRG